ncbi:TBCC domain-containing protein 1 [Frankliniella fusca]|uniref:TBCC domain-containing protein 1 n=1 Tax=Frankliniella fusca TaxID=407009 RepID=A0AAE1HW02_9NEOP|nr:TBCC domain-containing protein 1 [Frankliniella fusca]
MGCDQRKTAFGATHLPAQSAASNLFDLDNLLLRQPCIGDVKHALECLSYWAHSQHQKDGPQTAITLLSASHLEDVCLLTPKRHAFYFGPEGTVFFSNIFKNTGDTPGSNLISCRMLFNVLSEVCSQVFVRENRPYCETHLELLSLQRKTQKKAQTLRCCKFDDGISSNSTLPDRRTHSPHLQNIVIL